MLLQWGFGMPIGFVEGSNGIFEIVKLTELRRYLGEDKSNSTANRFFAIGDDAFDRHSKLFEQFLDCFEQSSQIALRLTEQRTGQQYLLREAVTQHPEHLVAYIWLQSIECQDNVPLLLQTGRDPLVVSDAQGHKFFRALHQIGHTALCKAHATCQENLIHLRHTALFAKTPLTDQGNHSPAKFAVGQRPASFFFWSIGVVITRTGGLNTLTHHEGQFPQTRERGHRAVAVMGHPQGLTTLLTLLFEWGECHLMRRFGARVSAGHCCSPVGLVNLLLLSGSTSCQPTFALQPFFWYSGKRLHIDKVR